jgi:hypothetical protein
MNWLFREPDRDPKLAAALRQVDAAPDAGRAEDLRRRIMASVRPRLADASPRPWWDWLSGWVRIAVPIGLAASVAAGLFLPHSIATSTSSYTTEAGADSTLIVAALSEPSTGGELAAHLIAPEGSDWLMEEALTQ